MRRALASLLPIAALLAACAPPRPAPGPDAEIAPAETGPERPELSPDYEHVLDIIRWLPPPRPAGR
ncbi:MAG: hypothetical protein ACQEUZ_13860 [Pseudomonadota bacterium]